jgi:signal transduction histidine kinase
MNKPFVSIGIGEQDSRYEELDRQLFELAKNQTIVPVSNFNRFKRLTSPLGLTPPGSLLSVPLYYENEYFGVIWIGFKQPKNFTESDVQFLSTLAGQAALAAGNAKLYMNAELGRERFEAVLNSTPEPVMVFDEFDRLFLINPAAKHLTGLVRLGTTGALIDDIIENKDLLTLLKNPTMDRDTSRDIELSNNRVYYTTVSPVNTMDRLVGKVCILRDITHFKELDTLKSDIVATVSHDLRSPLTLMRGYATMLQMVGELNEQQKNYVGKIVTGVDNMSKLVNNLLDLGRIEAGIGLNIEPIYPGVIVEQVLTQLQPQANQKKININFHSSLPAALKVELDPALIQQAIYNLIENGIKYTAIGGNVDIYLRQKPDHQIVFEVHDTGIGISPIDLPRLFDKFYRSGRREAYKERGTGLGLAIVKSITERHNGKVWVESKLGRGSVFYMSLPAIRW